MEKKRRDPDERKKSPDVVEKYDTVIQLRVGGEGYKGEKRGSGVDERRLRPAAPR